MKTKSILASLLSLSLSCSEPSRKGYFESERRASTSSNHKIEINNFNKPEYVNKARALAKQGYRAEALELYKKLGKDYEIYGLEEICKILESQKSEFLGEYQKRLREIRAKSDPLSGKRMGPEVPRYTCPERPKYGPEVPKH